QSAKPASSDSGVVADSKRRQSIIISESVVSRKSQTTLSPPESIAEKRVKKTKKSSSAAVENGTSQTNKEGEKSVEKKPKAAGSVVATRLAQISRTESSPLKMPVIHIQPPTPATNVTSDKKKMERSASPLTIKIPSPSSSSLASPLSNAPTSGISSPSTETLQIEEKKRVQEDEKPTKRRVWKQEKYSANEASESRRSTEVISVPKNQLPPSVETERAAAVKKRALASPLAERIARMENMAKERQKEQEKRGRLKIDRESSSSSSFKKEPSPAPPSKISIVTEKAATTTKTTTITTKNKTEEKEAGSTVTTGKNKIEVRDKSEKETQAVKVHQMEVKEEKSLSEETPKKSVNKTVVKKTSTSTTTEKEKKIRGRSESIESSVSTVAKSDRSEVEFSAKHVANGSTVTDGEVKLGLETKRKVRMEKNEEGKHRVEASEKDVASLQVRDKETKKKVKKTTLTTMVADDRREEKSTSSESTPVKKNTKPKVPKEKEISPPIYEYPAGLAGDIQKLKDARAKAKKREEDMQNRHVRFADETASAPQPEPQVTRSTKLELTSEEERGGDDRAKTRRKSSFFEVTEEEKDKLESMKEDFSFANLRQRLQKQLSKKGSDDSDEEPPIEPKKEVIVCPSTNSLLKKWKNIEQSNC
ncbi:hypothetical protein PENTCL1PPCAC_29565, partial [Pristionchus entomophagus]